ncbi:MAG TPA: hypothetical protein VD968_14930 [Pyrinomonadaceae bacterium]|nr:hypothetical protein [Pyrinomonadaceae bacterium]
MSFIKAPPSLSKNCCGRKPGRPRSPEEAEYLPNVAGAYAGRGQIRSKRGDSDAALADFDRAVELQPQNAFVHVERGGEGA